MSLKDRLSKLVSGAKGDAPESFRDIGDRLRDAGKYSDAAEAYEAHLVDHPDDFSIWVQRGNCLKDSGSHAAAERAYERAMALKPDDADVHLQLGHLYKMMGSKKKAYESYSHCLSLNPNFTAAQQELAHLGVKVKAAAVTAISGPAYYLDISDLLVFLNDNSRVTGIQRVQASIVQEVLKKYKNKNYVICYCDQDLRKIFALDAQSVFDLLEVVALTTSGRILLDDALTAVHARKHIVTLRRDDVYIIMGAFWLGDDYIPSLLSLRSAGVKLGVYIYDLIPLTHPQFVADVTRDAVTAKFGDIISIVDFVLTISEYVAKEVGYMLTSLGLQIPVQAVPLAHALPESEDDDGDLEESFRLQVPEEFVLCVCSLEGRKNHLLLLEAWLMMSKKHGGKVPALLLVGKWGWRIEEFQRRLNATRNADGAVVIMGNVSDAELKYLYDRCLFTVFPSFVEGWGLPVGESLAHGKPCIASNTSSIPEVGGDFCRYINPYDPISATDLIEKTLFDRPGLAEWTARVQRDFHPRTWEDVTDDFVAKLHLAASAVEPQSKPPISLDPGVVYDLTASPRTSSGRGRAIKFLLAKGWDALENWGVWANRRQAKISFGVRQAEGERIRILIELSAPPSNGEAAISVRNREAAQNVFVSAGASKKIWFEATVGPHGQVDVDLQRIDGEGHDEGHRTLYFGASMIAYCGVNDLECRLNIVESLMGVQHGAA